MIITPAKPTTMSYSRTVTKDCTNGSAPRKKQAPKTRRQPIFKTINEV